MTLGLVKKLDRDANTTQRARSRHFSEVPEFEKKMHEQRKSVGFLMCGRVFALDCVVCVVSSEERTKK